MEPRTVRKTDTYQLTLTVGARAGRAPLASRCRATVQKRCRRRSALPRRDKTDQAFFRRRMAGRKASSPRYQGRDRWHAWPDCGTSLHRGHYAARNKECLGQRPRYGSPALENRASIGLSPVWRVKWLSVWAVSPPMDAVIALMTAQKAAARPIRRPRVRSSEAKTRRTSFGYLGPRDYLLCECNEHCVPSS
jgi:hypothetical protein